MSVRYKSKEDEEKAQKVWEAYVKSYHEIKKIKNDIILTLQKIFKTDNNATERQAYPSQDIKAREGPLERLF